MLASECFGYEKQGKRGESTHRPNETKDQRPLAKTCIAAG
jgi:hypothetical protein